MKECFRKGGGFKNHLDSLIKGLKKKRGKVEGGRPWCIWRLGGKAQRARAFSTTRTAGIPWRALSCGCSQGLLPLPLERARLGPLVFLLHAPVLGTGPRAGLGNRDTGIFFF